jgi:hypothetical protein
MIETFTMPVQGGARLLIRLCVAMVRFYLTGILAVISILPTMFRVLGWIGWAWATFSVVAMCWPHSLLPVVIVACVFIKKRKPRLWAHGTARWADEKDLDGCIKATKGILLGRLIT